MKQHLSQLLTQALASLHQNGVLPQAVANEINIERTRQKAHGDFACNIALSLSKLAGMAPRDLAQQIIDALPPSAQIAKIEIAGPGFINFFVAAETKQATIPQILEQGEHYGRSQFGQGQRILLEFVSANPTGPLHVGHGRGAAYGATLGNVLEAVGYTVHREYYVNDAGRQMDILATSVWLRYLELCGEELRFPNNGYRGDYVWDIAADLHRTHGEIWRHGSAELMRDISPDEGQDGGDKEAHIDDLVARCKGLLGESDYRQVFAQGLNTILADIRKDLQEFGVSYDEWFSENSLMQEQAVQQAIQRLRQADQLYEKDGALWFRSSNYGDEKDRVIQRENGQFTYFASDIAYHMHKLDRGYDRLIDVWGADHHGYVPRVKAALQALGASQDKLDVLLVQFAILYRSGERVQMSTRSGEFVTLRELRHEVGNDAARFFYVLRKSEQHMDFDLDLAKSQSNDNPVYYVQYAHARVCNVFAKLKEKDLVHDSARGDDNLALLTEEHEQSLVVRLAHYPEVLLSAAQNEDPHLLAYYLRDLATDFHAYYNAHNIIRSKSEALRDARLRLSAAVRQVIANGLGLLGVNAPESM